MLRDLPWTVFLVWTVVGFLVMPLGLNEATVQRWLAGQMGGAVADAAIGLLRASDAVWICLGATVIYLNTAAREGLRLARIWAAIVLPSAALFEWIGATTGWPFGPYDYTDRFGLRIGGVLPFTIPLAWFIILVSGRAFVLRLRPTATRLELALGVGIVGVLTDLNLEFIAWKERGYWVWYPGSTISAWPPWQNFLSWFALMFLLCYALPAGTGLRRDRPVWAERRSIRVLLLMNALFLLTHFARWLRGSGG